MGFDEQVTREGVVDSCQDLMRFQAMFSRHFVQAPVARFGDEGERAIRAGLRRYGAYRADLIRKNLNGAPLTARSLVESWDMADYHLLTEVGTGAIEGSDRSVTVTIQDGPDWARWREYEEGLATARLYYAEVWPGIAAALGASMDLDVSALDLRSPWSVTWTVPSAPDGPRTPVHSGIFDRLDDAVAMARRTSMNNGALYYFCGDAVTRRFDMVGEAALRENVRAIAIERADRQKAAHQAAGLPINVKTLMDNWDGPLVAVWRWEPGILSEGTWFQDCTWCPYAAAWGEFGQRGLDLGYIWDFELHPTYYRRYHPDMVVQFEAIKTRGDSMCKFRVSIPPLQKPDEPTFVGYTGVDV